MFLDFSEAVKEARRQANESGEVRYVGSFKHADCYGYDVLKRPSHNAEHNYEVKPEIREEGMGNVKLSD